MSLCESCKGLEIWPGVFQARYLCGPRFGETIRAFSAYGRNVSKGIPQVKQCAKYVHGKHYSRKGIDHD